MRILICEDDPSRSEALGASVAIACPGAEVQRAVPGTSVARAVAEAAPALTVVGPGLADADGGSELVRVLCAEHPELAVLVVSTHDLAAPAVAALRAGAADYVVLGHGDDLAALGRAAARLVRRDGHRPPRGAFTGAVQERPGVLQLADRGTLFLDEVEDLVPALQAKLLRVVQDREVRPLGASSVRRFDVRIVAASNRDLWRMVEAGQFRRDLFYRLRVFAITLPPLRQRRDDLPALIEHFIARFNRAQGTTFALPPPGALRPLLEHSWPGNVRELENVLESLLVLAGAEGVELAELLARGQPPGAGLMVDERARIVRV